MRRVFSPGEWVVFRKTKFSPHPGPRAADVAPSTHGEEYSYTVDKYWIVQEVLDNRQLILQTKRGKKHILPITDSRLRKANWWERWRHRSRFEEILKGGNPSQPTGKMLASR